MCLIFISIHDHPVYKLVVAANRDEFYNRKTSPADWWRDQPNIVGGRDLEAGGTWMAMNRDGRISLVTNYRDLKNIKSKAPSRGHLVSDYLESNLSPENYSIEVEKKGSTYNGFNLLTGTAEELWYVSNYKLGVQKLIPGFHGLSNHLLDTPWPKVVRGKENLKAAIQENKIQPDELLDALHDEVRALDATLPDTGVGIVRERELSSMFIKSPGYGTRCSTVVLVDKNNHVSFTERVYNLETFQYSTGQFEFDIVGT